MDYGGPEFQADMHIPVDLFISKKSHNGGSQLHFANSSGDLVFKFERQRSLDDQSNKRQLLDAATGNPLISICRIHKGSWQITRDEHDKPKEVIFKVERTLKSLTRTELEVCVQNGDLDNLKPDLKIKGSTFHRSCTVYKGDSIVAQTSLMYKLGIWKVYVPRNRFRLTIFPGFSDHAAIVALIIIFFNGRKLWI